MNEDFTLTTFAEPITALADDPQLPPDEMKRRLQAPADELRQAHNALAATVKGITDATYPETVTEAMLTNELAAKLNGKADADDVTAETQSLDARLDTVEATLPQKCACYCGTFTGDGTQNRLISLGFTPKAVLVMETNGFTCLQYNGTYVSGGLALVDQPVVNGSTTLVAVSTGGFTVSYFSDTARCNRTNVVYVYLAFQ